MLRFVSGQSKISKIEVKVTIVVGNVIGRGCFAENHKGAFGLLDQHCSHFATPATFKRDLVMWREDTGDAATAIEYRLTPSSGALQLIYGNRIRFDFKPQKNGVALWRDIPLTKWAVVNAQQ